jgi:hypothetical protein
MKIVPFLARPLFNISPSGSGDHYLEINSSNCLLVDWGRELSGHSHSGTTVGVIGRYARRSSELHRYCHLQYTILWVQFHKTDSLLRCASKYRSRLSWIAVRASLGQSIRAGIEIPKVLDWRAVPHIHRNRNLPVRSMCPRTAPSLCRSHWPPDRRPRSSGLHRR